MRLALFQPDIPQNLGAAMRLTACLGVGLDIIEPCGFPLSDKALKRSAMDYEGHCDVVRWDSWAKFQAQRIHRVVLLSTRGAAPVHDFAFQPDDILLMGRESAGVPEDVHESILDRLYIPIMPQTRSMNVVTAAAIALGEGLRQTMQFPTGFRPY